MWDAEQMVKKWLTREIKSSLEGTLDDKLAGAYLRGAACRELPAGLKCLGAGGRVELAFGSADGRETKVDLGGDLETGYIVNSLEDGLGLFPDGVKEGDMVDASAVMDIVQNQGKRDGARS
jgi:hypothetical protein